MKISVIGAGAFGTAMAAVAARCGNEVLLWAHDPKVADASADAADESVLPSRCRARRLVSARRAISPKRRRSATRSSWSTPSHHYRRVLSDLARHLTKPVSVISGTKGIENETLERMSEVTANVLGARLARFAALSGPTFAIEVARAAIPRPR